MVPLVVMQIAVAAAQDVLFAIAVGAFACGVMLGRDARATQAFAATLGRLRLFALCVLALACCLYLWLQATVMSGGPLTEAGQAVTAVLTQSHYGMAWTAG
ncbi:MAG: copper resistance protein CopD, partial [Caballeronia sp.]